MYLQVQSEISQFDRFPEIAHMTRPKTGWKWYVRVGLAFSHFKLTRIRSGRARRKWGVALIAIDVRGRRDKLWIRTED